MFFLSVFENAKVVFFFEPRKKKFIAAGQAGPREGGFAPVVGGVGWRGFVGSAVVVKQRRASVSGCSQGWISVVCGGVGLKTRHKGRRWATR